ncbi:MAG: alpha/beta fold hydrolase [Flavobacteriales bacterium]
MKLHSIVSGQGPDLVILHGLFGLADNWVAIAKKLESHFTVHLVDQRNHGRSPHDKVFNYQEMANDLLSLGLSKFSLIGHSMGGKTAMFFAKQHPEKLDKLVVVDIGVKHYPVHHQQIIDALLQLPIHLMSSRNEADEMLKESIPDFGTRQFLLKNLHRVDEHGFEWRFNLQVIAEQIEEVGKALEGSPCMIPTLFIRGAKSRYIVDEDWEGILAHFPNAKLKTIENAGHWVHAEQPEILFNELNSFLV